MIERMQANNVTLYENDNEKRTSYENDNDDTKFAAERRRQSPQ